MCVHGRDPTTKIFGNGYTSTHCILSFAIGIHQMQKKTLRFVSNWRMSEAFRIAMNNFVPWKYKTGFTVNTLKRRNDSVTEVCLTNAGWNNTIDPSASGNTKSADTQTSDRAK